MTQAGFWRNMNSDNRRLYLRDAPLISNVWYLFPQGGGPAGAHTFQTFAALSPRLRSRDTILLSGVLREQATTPLGVFDVTIIGAANKPRQATSGGVPAGGGASWLAPTSPVALTPLISVLEQGWEFNNIQMAPVAGAPCIWLRRQESATIPDASHCRIISCYFSTGGAGGIGIGLGETSRNRIEDCDFDALDGGGNGVGIGYVTDGGFAVNTMNHIIGNRFHAGTNFDIQFPGTKCLIENNIFEGVFATEGGYRIDLDGGALNMVINNYTKDIAVTNALGFRKGSAADVWRNFAGTVVDPVVVVPA